MKDASPCQGAKYEPGNETVREFSAAELKADPERNPYVGRETRFYATVLFDGAKWQDRPSDVAGLDPEGRVQTGYTYSSSGEMIAGLDTRQSLMESWNGTKVGDYLKKYMDESVDGQYFNNENAWLEMR